MREQRIYPVGIQDFEKLRKEKALYVDKTDLIYNLTRKYYVFLSRPRRFGKSLLSSTLKYYFQGRKDLFQGLAIEQLEQEWLEYPVLHFDLSTAKNRDLAGIQSELDSQLRPYEVKWNIQLEAGKLPGQRLSVLIKRLHEQTGKKAVVIIDEYDAPMLDVLHDDERMAEVRKMMQEFYAPLKACDADLRFVFITGISPIFTDSILGGLNNFTDYSMQSEFASICGFTKEELIKNCEAEILLLNKANESKNEALEILYNKCGGYRFTSKEEEIYHPHYVLEAFKSNTAISPWEIEHQLVRGMKEFLSQSYKVCSESFYKSLWKDNLEILPQLYLNGYLTIKSYDKEFGVYELGLPNMNYNII